MTAPARFKQSDIERMLNAAKKVGFESVRVRVDASGEIEMIAGLAANDEGEEIELD